MRRWLTRLRPAHEEEEQPLHTEATARRSNWMRIRRSAGGLAAAGGHFRLPKKNPHSLRAA